MRLEPETCGILKNENETSYILTTDNKKLFTGRIWKGYLTHWKDKQVCAAELPQKDYKTGKPIIIVWPEAETDTTPFIELYYNERLIKYRASLLGHIAININNTIYNFSNKLNENEILTPVEYFYRPALGEFAPHPETGRYNITNPKEPYYDKFGRLFMRTIHVLRITGIKTSAAEDYLKGEMNRIDQYKTKSASDNYTEFRLFTRNCATIIRDALRENLSGKIRGIFPLDLFIRTSFEAGNLEKEKGWNVTVFAMNQLKTDEAEFSRPGHLINPVNIIRKKRAGILI